MFTYASHGPYSAARIDGRLIRGPLEPTQPVNNYLEAAREDWGSLTRLEKVSQLRFELLFLADPVTHLDEIEGDQLADLTLGELQHARRVYTRLLRLLNAG